MDDIVPMQIVVTSGWNKEKMSVLPLKREMNHSINLKFWQKPTENIKERCDGEEKDMETLKKQFALPKNSAEKPNFRSETTLRSWKTLI